MALVYPSGECSGCDLNLVTAERASGCDAVVTGTTLLSGEVPLIVNVRAEFVTNSESVDLGRNPTNMGLCLASASFRLCSYGAGDGIRTRDLQLGRLS